MAKKHKTSYLNFTELLNAASEEMKIFKFKSQLWKELDTAVQDLNQVISENKLKSLRDLIKALEQYPLFDDVKKQFNHWINIDEHQDFMFILSFNRECKTLLSILNEKPELLKMKDANHHNHLHYIFSDQMVSPNKKVVSFFLLEARSLFLEKDDANITPVDLLRANANHEQTSYKQWLTSIEQNILKSILENKPKSDLISTRVL